MVGAERAFVVAVRTTSNVDIEMRDPRLRMVGDISSIEVGFVVITATAARMLSRTRSGRAEGAMKAVVGSRSITIPLKMEYRGGISLLPSVP